jgi:hypothetical protein
VSLSVSKEISMRIPALAIFVMATIAMMSPTRAQTYNPRYPICAKIIQNFGGERYECAYDSMEQCQARVSGLGGQCVVNPYYAGARNRRY